MKFFKRKKTKEEVIKDLKKKAIKLAIESGKDWDVYLDFSENSLKDLSKILNEFHSEYKKNPEIDGLMGICYNYGFYIMAVIEKNIAQGKVEINDPEFGDQTFPFTVDDFKLFPVFWCLKQIQNGKQDDVHFKYLAMKSELKNNKKNY